MHPIHQTLITPDAATITTDGTSPSARWYGAASNYVALFLHRLQCIPASMWLAAADAAEATSTDSTPAWLLEEQADYAARRRLHDAIESMPVVARRIRDRVNSALSVFEGMVPAAAVQRMRRVAHVAAFALAACQELSLDDVRRLYRPFHDLIPPPRELLGE